MESLEISILRMNLPPHVVMVMLHRREVNELPWFGIGHANTL